MSLVSVVICTKNRANKLAKCLSSVSHLKYPRYEIIVVDSSSTPIESHKVKKLSKIFGANYFYESKIGLSVARNRGIYQAKGKVIAFTDDDCVVDEKWLSCGVRHFKNPNVGCVIGRVEQDSDDLMSQIYGQLFPKSITDSNFSKIDFNHLIKFLAKRILSLFPSGVGCNMMIRKSLFNKIGLFDEKLGIGTVGGEELDMFYRILKAGYSIIYDSSTVVYHKHEFRSFQELINILEGRERGCAYFWLKHARLGDLIAITITIAHTIRLLIKIILASWKGNHIITFLSIIRLKGWFKGLLNNKTPKFEKICEKI